MAMCRSMAQLYATLCALRLPSSSPVHALLMHSHIAAAGGCSLAETQTNVENDQLIAFGRMF